MIMEVEQNTEEEVTTDDYENESEDSTQEEGGSEDTSTTEESGSSKTYTQAELDARIKEQDKRWKDRLKDSKKGSKESDDKEVTDDRYERLELKTEGITNKKEQDVILDYAKYKNISPVEAMKSPAIRAELAELRAKNVPAPSTRTSNGANDSYDYYAKNIKAGKIRLSEVPDATMRQRLMKGKIF